MTLYHFTAAHMLKPILEEGITRGHTPFIATNGEIMLVPGTQWLTTNKDFKQSWCDRQLSSLPYDRDAFRLRIEIPPSQKHNLVTWPQLRARWWETHAADRVPEFDDPLFHDAQNWRVFLGNIHPLWIKDFFENRNGYRACPPKKAT